MAASLHRWQWRRNDRPRGGRGGFSSYINLPWAKKKDPALRALLDKLRTSTTRENSDNSMQSWAFEFLSRKKETL
jgi:hypothetical protein